MKNNKKFLAGALAVALAGGLMAPTALADDLNVMDGDTKNVFEEYPNGKYEVYPENPDGTTDTVLPGIDFPNLVDQMDEEEKPEEPETPEEPEEPETPEEPEEPEEPETPEEPEEPEEPEKPETPEKPEKPGEKPSGDKKPSDNPKTGLVGLTGVLATLVTASGAYFVSKKNK